MVGRKPPPLPPTGDTLSGGGDTASGPSEGRFLPVGQLPRLRILICVKKGEEMGFIYIFFWVGLCSTFFFFFSCSSLPHLAPLPLQSKTESQFRIGGVEEVG